MSRWVSWKVKAGAESSFGIFESLADDRVVKMKLFRWFWLSRCKVDTAARPPLEAQKWSVLSDMSGTRHRINTQVNITFAPHHKERRDSFYLLHKFKGPAFLGVCLFWRALLVLAFAIVFRQLLWVLNTPPRRVLTNSKEVERSSTSEVKNYVASHFEALRIHILFSSRARQIGSAGLHSGILKSSPFNTQWRPTLWSLTAAFDPPKSKLRRQQI